MFICVEGIIAQSPLHSPPSPSLVSKTIRTIKPMIIIVPAIDDIAIIHFQFFFRKTKTKDKKIFLLNYLQLYFHLIYLIVIKLINIL